MAKIYFLCVLLHATLVSAQAQQNLLPEIGIVQDIENDSLLKAYGYGCLIENTSKLLSPLTIPDQQFQEKLQVITRSQIPLFACNIFIPGDMKVVGPAVREHDVLAYVEKVFARARQAGLTMIIWGSGGSRRVPDGFDKNEAKNQFISIATKIAHLAATYNITLALENLNSTETNFITTVAEALEVVKAVNHKNLRLCVDIYHMLKENEQPDVITTTRGYTVYCEVAEKEGRTPPGVNGDNFGDYFSALKMIGFDGKMVIECRWTNIETQGQQAYREVHRQLFEAYH